jgi:hypothetical protein
MKQSDVNKAIKKMQAEQQIKVVQDGVNRARSVTVGTAFGGTIEISMRVDGGSIWAILQPVEALELAHQIAAAAGCHVAMRPREDFGSWREWKPESSRAPQFPAWSEHPPQVENKPTEQMLPTPEKQPGMKTTRSNKNVMATEKTVDRRSTKRAAKSS